MLLVQVYHDLVDPARQRRTELPEPREPGQQGARDLSQPREAERVHDPEEGVAHAGNGQQMQGIPLFCAGTKAH